MNAPPSSATAAKDRLYAQLAASFGRLNRSISRTADLCDELQDDLQATRTFAGLDAAKFVLEPLEDRTLRLTAL